MKRILITGADSFIGSSFEKYACKNYRECFQIEVLDMKNPQWKLFDFSGYDCIFHVAGIAHSDNGKVTAAQSSLYYSVNTDLTLEVASKAKASGVKQFIFMSSAIVYGNSSKIGEAMLITRDTPTNPSNCYGDSKVRAENGLLKISDNSFKVVLLRPPMIYGKGCKGNYPTLSKLAKNTPLFPKVKNLRSMLYIENLCEFIGLVIKNEDSGIFFPQNSTYSNTSELVKLIGEAHNKKVYLVKGFTFVLKILGFFIGAVDKAFGSLAYDMAISEYKEDYRVVKSLAETVRLTEDCN